MPSILPKTWEVPDLFRQRLGDQVGRQRCMVADGHLLLILHAAPGPDDTERQGRLFWRRPDGEWLTDQSGNGIGALDRLLTEYQDGLDVLEGREGEAQSPEAYFEVIQALAPINRSSTNLLSALQDAREQLKDVRELINFRDRAGVISRTAELTYAEARYGLEFVMAKGAQAQGQSSIEMAKASHRLNVLAAFFFPIVTLAGLFGVNLQHGLEGTPAPVAFLGLIGVGLFFGVVLKVWVTRRGKPTQE